MSTILLSINPEYVEKIFDGTKKYEYRKKFRKEKTKAFIYLSKTKKSICALIEFEKPIYATSPYISDIAENENEGSYGSMMEYLGVNSSGYAIPITKIYIIDDIPYATLKESFGFVAHQSYHLLNKGNNLREFLEEKEIKKIMEL